MNKDDCNANEELCCRQLCRKREREATQALLEEQAQQAVEEKRDLEERTAKLLEEERAQNDAFNRAMYELIAVSFFFIFAKSCTIGSFH